MASIKNSINGRNQKRLVITQSFLCPQSWACFLIIVFNVDNVITTKNLKSVMSSSFFAICFAASRNPLELNGEPYTFILEMPAG